jgi:hypothetical protein
MFEMIRNAGLSNEEIISLIEKGDSKLLKKFGDETLDWQTLIEYYQKNKLKCQQALIDGYEITFLTKGALKSLLKIKYNLCEGKDFLDAGDYLDEVKLSDLDLQSLKFILSKNWTIVEKKGGSYENHHVIKIELTNKPKW